MNYKPAKIYYGCKRNPKLSEAMQPKDITREWYLFYYFKDPYTQKFKKFYKRENLNRIHNLKERIAKAEIRREAINELLAKGLNPYFKPPEKILVETGSLAEMKFKDALEFSYQKRVLKVVKHTANDYKSCIKLIKQAIDNANIDIPVHMVRRIHCKQIAEQIMEMGKSNKRRNRVMENLSSLFTELMEWEAVDFNPVKGIKALPEHETERHPPLTPDERIKVKEYLLNEHPDYYQFYLTIYYQGMRISEICRLQFKDVHLDTDLIILPHVNENNEAKTKTKFLRKIPLFPAIREIVVNRIKQVKHLDNWQDMYIFSTYFVPGNKVMKFCTPTDYWKRFVIDELGVNKSQYSAKHLRADDLIEANVDLDSIKVLFGHNSRLTTEIYARKVKEKRNKELREKAPEF